MPDKDFFTMDFSDSQKNREGFISTGIEKLDRLLEGGTPKGFTIDEIAEALGAFPSDIEEIIKALYDDGKVSAFWYEGRMYVSMSNGENLETYIKEKIPHDPMFG